jgi:hypothetical protein
LDEDLQPLFAVEAFVHNEVDEADPTVQSKVFGTPPAMLITPRFSQS